MGERQISSSTRMSAVTVFIVYRKKCRISLKENLFAGVSFWQIADDPAFIDPDQESTGFSQWYF
jgi:hypothetical protein